MIARKGVREETVKFILDVQSILKSHGKPMSAYNIARKLDVSSSKASFGLRILYRIGAVDRVDKRNDRWFYSLIRVATRDEIVEELKRYGRENAMRLKRLKKAMGGDKNEQ